MFPIKDRIIINGDGDIVCAYIDNVLISDEQYRLCPSSVFDSYLKRDVEFEVEINNKGYLMYYYFDISYVDSYVDETTCIAPLTFHYGLEI
jgi:hypothetical protein